MSRLFSNTRALFEGLGDESFGGVASRGAGASRKQMTTPAAFRDPRLRGLAPPPKFADPYDREAARYRVMRQDPNDAVAQRELEIGRRAPLPYQSASALAGMPSVTGVAPEDTRMYADMHSDHAVNPASAVAGQRQTHWGTTGARTETQGGPWFDARKRFGYGEMRSRGTGYSDEWDAKQGKERTAGRLERPTTFDQEVIEARPYLHLRAAGTSVQAEGTYNGNAIMTVTAGNFQHGGVQVRQFWIGGGMVACFDLKGWDTVRINLQELLENTYVEFAWTDRGLSGGDMSLLYPERYEAASGSIPVPEGAFAISVEDPGGGPTTTLTWTGRRLGNIVFPLTDTIDTAVASSMYYGQRIEVKGPIFSLDRDADIMWWLRPI